MGNKGSSQKGFLLLLLLLGVNLVSSQSVSSKTTCPNGTGNCQVSLSDLFDRITMLSHYAYDLSARMFFDFYNLYGRDHGFIGKAISRCHTATISTPEDKEQTQQISSEHLLSVILSLLRSWNIPLYHIVTEVHGMQKVPETILSKAREIEEQNKRLREGLEKIVDQIYPGIKDNQVYAVWTDLPSLQMEDEETSLFAFNNLLRCQRRDAHKIDNFLKLLKCRIIYNNKC